MLWHFMNKKDWTKSIVCEYSAAELGALVPASVIDSTASNLSTVSTKRLLSLLSLVKKQLKESTESNHKLTLLNNK